MGREFSKTQGGFMSKRNEYGEADNQGTPEAANASTFCAIEEHAKALTVSAPVFAAVRQMQGWAAGKSVDKSTFEKAVNSFLNAPVGASAPMRGGK
jgi:hypothetical protein